MRGLGKHVGCKEGVVHRIHRIRECQERFSQHAGQVPDSEHRLSCGAGGEPSYTQSTAQTHKCTDYIFFSTDKLSCNGVVEVPPNSHTCF